MYKKKEMPEVLKQKALSMLETEDIDTVAAALRIRKAVLKEMVKDMDGHTTEEVKKALG